MSGQQKHEKLKQREVRVFISSTFRDFIEERNELARRVFPALRKLCAERSVVFTDVDLRWGVTSEQSAEGEVLPICLHEIDNCRPFFIGMLGERYGWVPDHISEALAEEHAWLNEHREKSVTELEIIHGVLGNLEMAKRTHFYFRTPAYIDSIPAKQQKDFISENPAAADKLENLKQEIRASGLPLEENYPDPQALADLVLEYLTKAIDLEFPPESALEPLDRDELDHDAFIQSRLGVYIGRQEYIDRLNQHIAGTGEPLVVLGESGSGKSALLSNWVTQYKKDHPDEIVLTHFIGATPYSSDWAAMLRRIMGEFKRKLGINAEIPGKSEELRAAFANWLSMAAARGRVILIFDALNQLEDRDQAPDLVWLPPMIPDNIRLVLSTLPGRPLEELRKRNWPQMEVELLRPGERKQLIREYLAQYTKSLTKNQVELIADAPQAANPLYVRAVLEELRVIGVHEQLNEQIESYLKAQNVPALYELILERYEGDYERERPGLVHEAMTLIWAARRGLSEPELLDILGTDEAPLPRAHWSPLYIVAYQSLVNRSGLITFAHDYIKQAVEHKYLSSEQQKHDTHLRIADYFEPREIGTRKVDELPWQLVETKSWDRLYALLACLPFFQAAWEKNPFEVKTYWTTLNRESKLSMTEAYKRIIEDPSDIPFDVLISISDLLDETIYPRHALELLSKMESRSAGKGLKSLQAMCLLRIGLLNMYAGNLSDAENAFTHCRDIAQSLKIASLVMDTEFNLAVLLHRQGKLKEAEQFLECYIEYNSAQNNHEPLSKALLELANIQMTFGKNEKAGELFRRAFDAAHIAGNQTLVADAITQRAAYLYKTGCIQEGERLMRNVHQIYRKSGNLAALGGALELSGLYCKTQGKYIKALEFQRAAVEVHEKLGHLIGLASALGNQAESLIRMERLEEAWPINERSIEIYRKLGIKSGLATSLMNEAIILRRKGQIKESLWLLEESENLYEEIGNLEGLGQVLGSRATILYIQGKSDQADKLYQQSITTLTNAEAYESLAGIHVNRGQLLVGIPGKHLEALENFDKAIEISDQHGFNDIALSALEVVARCYHDQGNLEISLTAAREWMRRAEIDNKPRKAAMARLIIGSILLHKYQPVDAEKIARESLSLGRQWQDPDMIAKSLELLGLVLREKQTFQEAARFLQEAAELNRNNQDWLASVNCMIRQAQIAGFDLNHVDQARQIVKQALQLAEQHNMPDATAAIQPVERSLQRL